MMQKRPEQGQQVGYRLAVGQVSEWAAAQGGSLQA